MKWFVYILHCANNTYYVGHTRDVGKRVSRHLAKTGARHTAMHPPDEVVRIEEYPTEEEAIRRERQLKGWTRAKKQALISGDVERLRSLSRSRENK